MRVRACLYSIAACAFTCSAHAEAPQPDTAGILAYSDMCLHGESGDLIGDRVILLRFPDGDYVYVQSAEGEIQPPQLAQAIVSRNNSDIAFRVSKPNGATGTFKGTITEEALTGAFENGWLDRAGKPIFRLPRIISRQQNYPKCE
jgi:hypothetical protein